MGDVGGSGGGGAHLSFRRTRAGSGTLQSEGIPVMYKLQKCLPQTQNCIQM